MHKNHTFISSHTSYLLLPLSSAQFYRNFTMLNSQYKLNIRLSLSLLTSYSNREDKIKWTLNKRMINMNIFLGGFHLSQKQISWCEILQTTPNLKFWVHLKITKTEVKNSPHCFKQMWNNNNNWFQARHDIWCCDALINIDEKSLSNAW